MATEKGTRFKDSVKVALINAENIKEGKETKGPTFGDPETMARVKGTIVGEGDSAEAADKSNAPLMLKMTPKDKFLSAAVSVHTAVKLTRVQRMKKRALWASKKLIVFTLSKVGLTCLVVCYVIAGAFLFQRLEYDHRGAGIQQGIQTSDPGTTLAPSQTLSPGYRSRRSPDFENTENLGSGLRCVEAIRAEIDALNITSIADKTAELRNQHQKGLWDRTIDLNVLYPEIWRREYNNITDEFEAQMFELIKKTISEHLQKALEEEPTARPVVADIPEQHWSFPKSLLFAVSVVTTIGYGDTVPVTDHGKIACILYGLIGIPMMLLCLSNIGGFLASCYRFMWKHISYVGLTLVRSPKRKEALKPTKEVRVPFSVALLTMFIYLMTGATIFSKWESWPFLDGCYFSFVTLSTIGFGDFVPGRGTDTLDNNAKRIVCALYLLFGLSLVAMTFQLIQDWVRVIIARYAEFFGLTNAQIKKEIAEDQTVIKLAASIDASRKNLEVAHTRHPQYSVPPVVIETVDESPSPPPPPSSQKHAEKRDKAEKEKKHKKSKEKEKEKEKEKGKEKIKEKEKGKDDKKKSKEEKKSKDEKKQKEEKKSKKTKPEKSKKEEKSVQMGGTLRNNIHAPAPSNKKQDESISLESQKKTPSEAGMMESKDSENLQSSDSQRNQSEDDTLKRPSRQNMTDADKPSDTVAGNKANARKDFYRTVSYDPKDGNKPEPV